MPRPKAYTEKPVLDSYLEVELSSWKYFHDYVRKEMLSSSHYFWRGQRDSAWGLETSFDRLVKDKTLSQKKLLLNKQLSSFKFSARGRRGNFSVKEMNDTEWWALGQHHSLATPLLDWTHAPFVALYFAFEKPESSKSGNRAVWAIYPENINKKILEKDKNLKITLETIRPHQDENSRLVSQSGLFTRAPLGETAETWVKSHGVGRDTFSLLKIVIPSKGREDCLRSLNRMNINHLSLFPDLYGSAQHSNKSILIDKY